MDSKVCSVVSCGVGEARRDASLGVEGPKSRDVVCLGGTRT